jgi:hypothetical protein
MQAADDWLVDKYYFFIFAVVKAHVAPALRHPQTLHYTGDGVSWCRVRSSAGAASSDPSC